MVSYVRVDVNACRQNCNKTAWSFLSFASCDKGWNQVKTEAKSLKKMSYDDAN